MPLSKSPSLLDDFRRPTQAPGGKCNLCKQKTSSLKRHIARHLEQMALFSIPRADYTNGDEDLSDDQKSASQGNVRGSVSDSLPESGSDAIGEEGATWNDPNTLIENPEIEEDSSKSDPVDQVDVPESSDPLWERVSTRYYDSSTVPKVPGDHLDTNIRKSLDHQIGDSASPVTHSLHGWSFRIIREPGVEASWDGAQKTPLPYSFDELLRIVNRITAIYSASIYGTSTLSKQFSSLRSSHQRALADALLKAVEAEERNPNAVWTFASIEQAISDFYGNGGGIRELVEMRVVLRRAPRPRLEIDLPA